MKNLITLIIFLFSTWVFSQDYKIVQVNAKWNTKNDVKLPNYISGVKVIYIYLEDQKPNFKNQIKYVPTILLFKNNKPIVQWTSNLSFKLVIPKDQLINEIKFHINK